MNYLIENPKCVFIHIPKTGGTSIRNIRNIRNSNTKVIAREVTIPSEWDEYFKFAFVRNPYDRAISAWHAFGGLKNRPFLGFLEIATNDMIPYKNAKILEENIRYHTISQLHPANFLKHANFIGRFENYQDDFNKICYQLKIPHIHLLHLNKTDHKHYSEYYDDQTLEIVRNYYENELKEFGYKFEKS